MNLERLYMPKAYGLSPAHKPLRILLLSSNICNLTLLIIASTLNLLSDAIISSC